MKNSHPHQMRPAHYDVAPGTRVIYMDTNGWAHENQEAREKGLVVDLVYEVESADVYDSCSYFHLRGIEGAFNTVMFTLADGSEPPSRDLAVELAQALAERDDARAQHIATLESYERFIVDVQAKLNLILEKLHAAKKG